MTRFGLIGYPLTHSFSKKYFTEKFEKEGLQDHVYELFPIPLITAFPGVISTYTDLRGLNVTIPYKQQITSYLTRSQLPANVDACNCIRVKKNELIGYNTDIIGFEKSFTPLLKLWHRKALVLGNGGAAAAVVHVLEKLNIDYNIVSRSLHNNSTLTYSNLNEEVMNEHKIIINTTPLGTFPNIDDCAPLPYDHIGSGHYLYDLVYNPAETFFLKQGAARGAVTRNGYEMLVIQAEESWKIWNAE